MVHPIGKLGLSPLPETLSGVGVDGDLAPQQVSRPVFRSKVESPVVGDPRVSVPFLSEGSR